MGYGNSITSGTGAVTTTKDYGMNITNVNSDISKDNTDNDFVVTLGDEAEDLAGAGGKTTVTMGFDGNTELKREMTIKNAELKGESGTATATNTIEFSNTGEYDNHILMENIIQ